MFPFSWPVNLAKNSLRNAFLWRQITNCACSKYLIFSSPVVSCSLSSSRLRSSAVFRRSLQFLFKKVHICLHDTDYKHTGGIFGFLTNRSWYGCVNLRITDSTQVTRSDNGAYLRQPAAEPTDGTRHAVARTWHRPTAHWAGSLDRTSPQQLHHWRWQNSRPSPLWATHLQQFQIHTYIYTYTHTQTFNGPLSGTTQVSRYQRGKTNLDFTEARDSEWQWHQLGHTQLCTLFQTDNHASTPALSFLQAGCPSCRPTNRVKALKAYLYV